MIVERDTRLGVPVPLGALVLTSIGGGRVIGGDKEFAIIEGVKGEHYCETWGAIDVQASGPAFNVQYVTGPVNVVTSEHPLALPAELRAAYTDDRYRRLQMKAAALMLEVEEARAVCLASLAGDHDELILALERFNLKAGEIEDNHELAAIRQACEAIWAKRNQTQDA